MNRYPLAQDLMTRPVRRLTVDATISDAAKFLLRNGISGAPVIDERGRWTGVLSLSDVARHVQDRLVTLPVVDRKRERTLQSREPIPEGFQFEGFEHTLVQDLMTPGLYSVFPEATLAEVLRTLTTQKIHRVFVIGEEGEMLGVVTTMDVLKWMEAQVRKPAVPPKAQIA